MSMLFSTRRRRDGGLTMMMTVLVLLSLLLPSIAAHPSLRGHSEVLSPTASTATAQHYRFQAQRASSSTSSSSATRFMPSLAQSVRQPYLGVPPQATSNTNPMLWGPGPFQQIMPVLGAGLEPPETFRKKMVPHWTQLNPLTKEDVAAMPFAMRSSRGFKTLPTGPEMMPNHMTPYQKTQLNQPSLESIEREYPSSVKKRGATFLETGESNARSRVARQHSRRLRGTRQGVDQFQSQAQGETTVLAEGEGLGATGSQQFPSLKGAVTKVATAVGSLFGKIKVKFGGAGAGASKDAAAKLKSDFDAPLAPLGDRPPPPEMRELPSSTQRAAVVASLAKHPIANIEKNQNYDHTLLFGPVDEKQHRPQPPADPTAYKPIPFAAGSGSDSLAAKIPKPLAPIVWQVARDFVPDQEINKDPLRPPMHPITTEAFEAAGMFRRGPFDDAYVKD